jgi:hypothetical protein
MVIQKKAGYVKFAGQTSPFAETSWLERHSLVAAGCQTGKGRYNEFRQKRRMCMSLVKKWCTLDKAESKYGIKKALILKWVEEGIVRSEGQKGKVINVNVDDLERKLEELVNI